MLEERTPKLFCVYEDKMKQLPLKGNQLFGRHEKVKQENKLEIGCSVVSRQHGRFITAENICQYQDIGDGNGTYHNKRKLARGEKVFLQDGDVLSVFGKDLNGNILGAVMIYSISYRRNLVWSRVDLKDWTSELIIGRDKKIRIGYFDQTVAKKHVILYRQDEDWLMDVQPNTNTVYLNNEPVHETKRLVPMDVLNISGYYFVYLGSEILFQSEALEVPENPISEFGDSEEKSGPRPKSSGSEGLEIRIEERSAGSDLFFGKKKIKTLDINLDISIGNMASIHKKTLLKDINLDIPIGNMVLILGGSGAGKTTFMNAVMGYEPAKGSVRYKGKDIYENYEEMKYEIGYVPQQDLLRMTDTDYNTLLDAAKMRLPVSTTKKQYEEQVNKTLKMLGLEREKDSLVGKNSGGQIKRVSIAVEYVGNPSLFFLDEPDSGLDGIMAIELMKKLREIADDGKIVMVISHQPDRAFEFFDQVIVLAKDSDDAGHLVFSGTPRDACNFFETENLEKILKRINREDEGGDGKAGEYIKKFNEERTGY